MIQKLVHTILHRPYFIFSFLALFIFLGINGYFNLDRKLFPNSNRPQIAVVVLQPSASAKDMAQNVALVIEEELYTIDYVRRVYSTTIDEVSVINAEFEYEKDLNTASGDVKNALDKIRSKLPNEINEPQIHKISAATAPIITFGVSSETFSMVDLRQILKDEIKEEFLKLSGVANVDIFGGYKKELQVELDLQKIQNLGLNLQNILTTLKSNNKDYAVGSIEGVHSKILLKSKNQKESIASLLKLQIAPNIKLKDIAKISFDSYHNMALYRGNGKDGFALAIQRNLDADVIKTIEKVENHLKDIQRKYPNLHFEITDTQKTTIVQSTSNMFESLRDAIIMSMIVVFIFLASFRQIIVVLLTIPIVYLSTIALMWLFGLEFNIITLTGIILALGLLLDDTVVVVENIQRHYESLHENLEKAVEDGTTEIMFADFSGTLTTMIALFPILFVGDYPQTIFGPLVSTLLLALGASYLISITFVPLISKKVLKLDFYGMKSIEKVFTKVSDGLNNFFVNFFTSAIESALKSRIILASYILALFVLFFISVKVVMPLVGTELMPAMDTGAVKIKVSLEPNLSLQESKKILKSIENLLYENGKIESISASIGSEAGVMSIGSGGGIGEVLIIANYVNRFQREEDIWSIEEKLKLEIAKLGHIKSFEVSDAGATAMASIKANIDVTLYGDDFEELHKKAKDYLEAMQKTQGIVSATKSWHMDTKSYTLEIESSKALFYGVNDEQIVRYLQPILRGAIVSKLDMQNTQSIPIRVTLKQNQINDINRLKNILIPSKLGMIPLSSVATITLVEEPNIITRDMLSYTIDIFGFREKESLSYVMDNFKQASKDIVLPINIKMKHTGDIEQFNDSSSRIIKSVAIGLVLIFLVMLPMFESFKIPLIIIFSIPLTMAGASWILLLFDYHSSMSAMVGFILLAGVIVNNAILLVHFALDRVENGQTAMEAMLESIKVRTRPVLMTAFSVSVGMIPVALGWAIGMERLAPLGAVVIGGLIVGTFLTLLFIPLLFIKSH